MQQFFATHATGAGCFDLVNFVILNKITVIGSLIVVPFSKVGV